MTGTFIIAEIGVNHNGDAKLLDDLVKSAAECGADACKFQTFKADKLASENTPKVGYQKLTSNPAESHLSMLKKLEMNHEMHMSAIDACDKNDIEFISTPYDPDSVDYLKQIGVKKIKTASADIVDYRIHKKIVEHGLKPIVAVGMATYAEISDLLTIYDNAKLPPTLLHCVSNYPCSDESLNLKCIQSMKKKFGYDVGFSDHSIGSGAAIASLAMGATIVEKHFTLDKNMVGPDHLASSTPEEFKELVCQIRRVEKMLGDGNKVLQEEEEAMLSISRKSIFALKDIHVGEIIREEYLTMRRPGGGMSGKQFYEVLGQSAKEYIHAGDMISSDLIAFK